MSAVKQRLDLEAASTAADQQLRYTGTSRLWFLRVSVRLSVSVSVSVCYQKDTGCVFSPSFSRFSTAIPLSNLSFVPDFLVQHSSVGDHCRVSFKSTS